MAASAIAGLRPSVPGLPVLLYHGIETGDPKAPTSTALRSAISARNWSWLRSQHFCALPPQAIADPLRIAAAPSFSASMTDWKAIIASLSLRWWRTGSPRPSSSTPPKSANPGSLLGPRCKRCSGQACRSSRMGTIMWTIREWARGPRRNSSGVRARCWSRNSHSALTVSRLPMAC